MWDYNWGAGGGLPTPYLAAGGAAVVIISALALAGAAPENAAPAASPTSTSSKSSGGSNSGKSGVLCLSLLMVLIWVSNQLLTGATCSKHPNLLSVKHIVNLGWFAYCKVRVVGSNVLYCVSESSQHVGSNILCCSKNAQACWPTLQAPRVVCQRAKTLSLTVRWRRRRILSSRRWTRGHSSRHRVQNCCQ